MKRIISLVLCMALCAGLLLVTTSCGKTAIKVAARTDVQKYFTDNGLTAYYENKANVTINWVDYGTGSNTDTLKKVQDSISAKDKPDVYMGLSLYPSDLARVGDQAFLDLTSKVDTTTNFKNILNNNPDMKSAMQTNGKLYSLPSFKQNFSGEYPVKAWINSAWLKKLNLSVPTTTDQLLTVLQDFKTKDPNGNGQAVTPLGAAYNGATYSTLSFIINAFLPAQFDLSDSGNYLSLDGSGKVVASVTDTRFQRALKYLNTLMSQGLMSRTVFTDNAQAMIAGSKGAEQTGVILTSDLNSIFNDPARCADYEPLPPLTNGYTVVNKTAPQIGGFMIAKGSNNADAALRLGDAMLSDDGTLTTFYSESGWSQASGTAFGADKATWKIADPTKVDGQPLSNIKGGIPYWYSSTLELSRQADVGSDNKVNMFTANNWSGYLSQITQKYYEPVGKTSVKYILPEITYTTAQTQKLTVNGTDIRAGLFTYMQSAARDFVTGAKNIDTGWAGFVTDLKSKGLDTMISVSQQAYDQQQ